MGNKYFGTDGIRDVANAGLLTPSRIVKTAQSLGRMLREGATPSAALKVGIGADTRISGSMILSALTAGLTALGVDVVDFGVLPTPALAELTRKRRLSLGIMISASHNPMADNGIKIFQSDGFKLSDVQEELVERLMESTAVDEDLPTGGRLGRLCFDGTGFDDYLGSMVDRFGAGQLKGLKVAVDCANGAAWKAAPAILTRLGAKVQVMANAPNGININDGCGSVHLEALQEFVQAEGCDVAVALDGDGDRSMFVDAAGGEVDGDGFMAFMGPWLKKQGRLAHDTVVTTVMSNIGLEIALRREGITMIRTPVGDRHVTECLRRGGYSLGGEQSGHLIFGSENSYTGDGIFSALKLFQALVAAGRPLRELVAPMKRFPQVLINVPVKSKPPVEELTAVNSCVERAEQTLGAEGRVLLRYSGTEKKMRVMTEGPTEELVRSLAETIADAVRAEIG